MAPREEIHILVVFSCQTGAMEQLALAAAVGAVQERASIRLRRIVEPSTLPNPLTERMDQDYIAPREADIRWADGFVLGVAEDSMFQLKALGGLAGKPAVSLRNGADLLGAELLTANPHEDFSGREGARLLGRRVAETARQRKVSKQRKR
jgi:hypothetical protein